MNTTHESESAQDFEALYLAYQAKYEASIVELMAIKAIVAYQNKCLLLTKEFRHD